MDKPNLTELERLIEEVWTGQGVEVPAQYRALKMLLDYCMYLESQIDQIREGAGDDATVEDMPDAL
jgi:hypothetical protein